MVSYKEYLKGLRLTEEEIESKLLELDEVNPIGIDSWEELDGEVINGYRLALAGHNKHILSISRNENGKERSYGTFNIEKEVNGKVRNYGIFNIELNPTFAIESYLMVLEVYVMMTDIGRVYCGDEVC